MRKFKHKKTDEIATERKSGGYELKTQFFIPSWLIEDSSDWEEILELEYEIVKLKSKNGVVSTYEQVSNVYKSRTEWVEAFLKIKVWFIDSIKRLSDGEIFSIGDQIKGKGLLTYTINDFHVVSNSLVMIRAQSDHCSTTSISTPIKEAEKVKRILFTTEDGVDVFENQKYWFINTEGCTPFWTAKSHTMGLSDRGLAPLGVKQFSSKEAADDYIFLNKPCLSLKDVSSVSKRVHQQGSPFASLTYTKLDTQALDKIVRERI